MAKRKSIDFAGLADWLLASADRLVPAWLPGGKLSASEYKCLNPRRADAHAGSFSINIDKGKWGDFATDDAGNDLVSLYAYINFDGDNVRAAQDLIESYGLHDFLRNASAKPREKPTASAAVPEKAQKPAPAEKKPKAPRWLPLLPVPADAPAPPGAHEFQGIPSRVWTYHAANGATLGYVCRFDKPDGRKEVLPLCYARHAERADLFQWRWLSFPEPRPLYGLDRLAAKPDATVLLVEGEKCADAAQAELPDLVVMAWPGGGKAVEKADWTPLAGRKVITWADCDSQREPLKRAEKEAGIDPESKPYLPADRQPGFVAMAKVRTILAGLGCVLFDIPVPGPGVVAGGLDVADLIEEGRRGADLADYIRASAKRWHADAAQAGAGKAESGPPRLTVIEGGKHAPPVPPEDGGGGLPPEPPEYDWRADLLYNRGEVAACIANVELILTHAQPWQGVIAYDEFAERPVHRKRIPGKPTMPESGDWSDWLDTTTAIILQRQWKTEFSRTMVGQVVEVVARENKYHPVRDMLTALPPWDGINRLGDWLSDYLHVDKTEYTALAGTYFIRAMVRRVMEPGCKFDYCLVLEGAQGYGKSTIANTIASGWFCDTDLDLDNKDSMLALPGHWVYEVAEMGSLLKAEERKQKSFLSRRFDEYRPPYGQRMVKVPRQCVFIGTTNELDGYLKDPTGHRRFWPVLCAGRLDLDALKTAIPLLFAEALYDFRKGARYWPTHEEEELYFKPEQVKRGLPELIDDVLAKWAAQQVVPFTQQEAGTDGLQLPADKLTQHMATRIGMALHRIGCVRIEKRNATTPGGRRPYVPPHLHEQFGIKRQAEPVSAKPAPAEGESLDWNG